MPRPSSRSPRTVQRVHVAEPQGNIDTRHQSRRRQARRFAGGGDDAPLPVSNALGFAAEREDPNELDSEGLTPALRTLQAFIQAKGDISHLLPAGVPERIGQDAIREFDFDVGSIAGWTEQAEFALSVAAQEDDELEGKAFPFEDSSDIHYPMLTVGAQQWAARAGPELIKGDQVVGVKSFHQPYPSPSPQQLAQNMPPPPDPQTGQQNQQEAAQGDQAENLQAMQVLARKARADRVKHYLNWVIFYKMDDWEGETDQLLNDIPITGAGFKKVWMTSTGLSSEYVSALKLVVHKDTKSIFKCPRISQVYDIFPYEWKHGQRTGRFIEDVELPIVGQDPEAPREFIEQHRMEDLDGDGLKEPYIVTVDRVTRQLMRIQPAFTEDDVSFDPIRGHILQIARFIPFPSFTFLRDPRGSFYGTGFGKLLAPIMDTVDTSINQLIDAGTAATAGGGFIGSGVRLQGSGAGGSLYFRPGEFQVVASQGPDLRNAIFERTIPQPSPVTYQTLEMLLAAAKDIASVKDVVTGDAPSTAPVGTTMALQNQALQVFSSIYRRVYRGFTQEFRIMYQCIKRWRTEQMVEEYQELTGGDLDQDFSGDGTDIVPVADPAVVTKMQKVSRVQALMQLAESPVGAAAGMQTSGPSQEIAREVMDTLDVERPDRFFGPVTPNPLDVAKVGDLNAAATLKLAQAGRDKSDTTLIGAKTLREAGLAAKDTHGLRQEASRIAAAGGTIHPPSEGDMNGAGSPPGVGTPPAGPSPVPPAPNGQAGP